MDSKNLDITKSSGEKVKFSLTKLRSSLKRSGADQNLINSIIDTVRDELYQGISTKEIYNRAYALLKKQKHIYASKYKLKKAIYELGPTGFPFEKFVASILYYSGYEVEVNKIMQGRCVSHEVDVIARKNENFIVVECKFHSEEGRNCDVKVPLYINSRYQDLLSVSKMEGTKTIIPNECWVVTNTRFTKDAMQYATCIGLHIISWDYPSDNGIKDRIDRLGLYPITVSILLSNREKQFLLSRDIVLCKELLEDKFYLDHLGISENRQKNILEEIKLLCNTSELCQN